MLFLATPLYLYGSLALQAANLSSSSTYKWIKRASFLAQYDLDHAFNKADLVGFHVAKSCATRSS